ncbi:hypothetical protein CXB51_011327 [Gossypium anomalum]|uniref:Uncharacterized protein n=1 Tax=Gossypium anomalum TaxID=47600 RepID=A0A8J5Z3R8_9ROSI|nr:hypothetical protein CXB51_011327 [Gossypium anomalum]
MGVEMKVHPFKVYTEAGTGRAETRFIKATNGSVFPKKRKLVKKMMLHSLLNSLDPNHPHIPTQRYFTTIMESRLNQGGEGGRAESGPARKEGDKKGAYRFQEKKGSVFPVKKKLVKTRMAECIANSLSSSKMGGSSNTTVTNTTPPKSSKSNKISTVNISPDP